MQNLTQFLLLLTILLNSFSVQASVAIPSNDCDTIYDTDGKMRLCHILQKTRYELLFSLCDDPQGKVYSISNQKVARSAFAKIQAEPKRVEPKIKPDKKTVKPKTQKAKPRLPQSNETLASGALWLSILSVVLILTLIFSPIGFILGIIAANKGQILLNKTKGQAKFKRIRRRARWAMWLGSISAILSSIFAIWFICQLSQWDMDLSGLENIGVGIRLFGPY